MPKSKPTKPAKPSDKHKPKKHAERLHVDMPFDELVARVVREKPPAKKK